MTGNGSTPANCIVCDSDRVDQFLDLGETALANKFLSEDELDRHEPFFPLRVGFCHGCGHVQLTEHVPPGAMFDLSDVVVERFGVGPGELVIDIGCNDGTLLEGFGRHGVRTLGVDPAKNLAEYVAHKGIDRYVGFFGADTVDEIVERWGRAAAVTATNTFPHIPDLRGFVGAIEKVLAPGGVFVIEAHYLLDIVDQLAFDTIYHEHVSYWALAPMMRLFADAGLEVVDAERLPLHHGQLRVSVQRAGEGQVRPSVEQILALERERGLDRIDTYTRFAEQTHELKRDLHSTIETLRRDGQRVAGYGAPAKGNTLLSFLEIGPQVVDYIADKSPLKQGRYTPGSHIPVVAPERLLEDAPAYTLLLAWNFVDEILAQQDEYRRRGGRFIVPVPQVRMV